MSLPLVDRPPTAREVERLRLILSTYQDGTGMEAGGRLPGWRDFERAVALAFGGVAQESKAIFDVLLSDEINPDIKYGLSCKMRGELNKISRTGRISLELSNSAKKFWQPLRLQGIDESNYRSRPAEVGISLIEVVRGWHNAVSIEHGGHIDITRSSYLVLSWDKRSSLYQLHQFSLELPDPTRLQWYIPTIRRRGEDISAQKINGNDELGTLFEWYGESGGQLKYYPLAANALWSSDLFRLEPLGDTEYGILNKAAAYFPELWATACENE